MTALLRSRFALVLVLALTACADEPTVSPADAAGTFVLESVSGRGPATGTITLTSNGRADRQAHFTSQGSPFDQHLVGSFRIEGDSIAFMLVPSDSPSNVVWPVTGLWLDTEFTLQYPDPSDGPAIVERYRRQ
ncbi:MAG TPA: hypothetical protein VF461_24265 [Gemmatimonadaceae bacterium]